MIVFNLYKGKKPYTYEQRHKSVNKRNRISGHSWTEYVPVNMWDISSPLVGVMESVRSEEKAQRLCQEYGMVDVYMPLTQRELDMIKHELV